MATRLSAWPFSNGSAVLLLWFLLATSLTFDWAVLPVDGQAAEHQEPKTLTVKDITKASTGPTKKVVMIEAPKKTFSRKNYAAFKDSHWSLLNSSDQSAVAPEAPGVQLEPIGSTSAEVHGTTVTLSHPSPAVDAAPVESGIVPGDHLVGSATPLPMPSDDVTPASSNRTGNAPEIVTLDSHEFYNSTVVIDPRQADALWVDLDGLTGVQIHDLLSESHRRAATVNLTFKFPYYGHPIDNATIAVGGFLYVGYSLHTYLAATQYIAPLMANFRASANTSNSAIRYFGNDSLFVVEWKNVFLDDDLEAGNFTFQISLHRSGDIVFVYRDIPVPVTKISEKNHPVKIGISDAYFLNRDAFLLRRKTIYEYHLVDLKSDLIRSHAAAILHALPTCVSLRTCSECMTTVTNFNCSWCTAVGRCSSGVDRHRQSWMSNKCEEASAVITSEFSCPVDPPADPSLNGHKHYNSSMIVDASHADALWIDLDSVPGVISQENNHNRTTCAAAGSLPFEFPFYGHPTRHFSIEFGGFLFVGDDLGKCMVGPNLIAPFKWDHKQPAYESETLVRYYANVSLFVVEWKTTLFDAIHDHKAVPDSLRYQVVLHRNGDIVFAYRDVPVSVSNLEDTIQRPEIGISDGALFDVDDPSKIQKALYPYHLPSLKSNPIKSHTAMILYALPMCASLRTCSDCLKAATNSNCLWCTTAGRCLSGLERHQSSWMNKCGEGLNVASSGFSCPLVPPMVATFDSHEYYNSTIIVDPVQGDALWIDLDVIPGVVSHRNIRDFSACVSTVNLTFEFPFYDHLIHNITIAYGGYLVVGLELDACTNGIQNIAPFFADFKEPTNVFEPVIRHYGNGSVFVAEWKNMLLKHKPDAGALRFQAILHKNGDIVFVYRDIPVPVSIMENKNQWLEIGVSDRGLSDTAVLKNIARAYRFSNLTSEHVRSHTAILFQALPTCASLRTCMDCMSIKSGFNCSWCASIGRCFSAADRHGPSWMSNKCDENSTASVDQCPADHAAGALASASSSEARGGTGGLSILLVFVALLGGLVGWVIYAYRNPGSTSGQLLIKYRPSQWKRYGEVSYIAAGSLHM